MKVSKRDLGKNKKFVGRANLLIDKARIKLMRTIPSEDLKLKIAKTIKDDNQKLIAISLVGDEFGYKGVIAETINNDDIKIEALKLFSNDDEKYPIIKTIKDDNKKIEAIDDCKDIDAVMYVLKSIDIFEGFNNPDGIYELLEIARTKEQNPLKYMKQQIQTAETVEEYKDDNEKITAADNIESEYLKAEIAKTIQDDDKKIDFISNISNEWGKAIIAQTIQDDSKKIEVINLLSSPIEKYNVAKTIEDDDKKIAMLDLFKDDLDKRLLAQTIQDDDKKIKAISLMKDEKQKGVLLETIEDDDKKIEAFSFFKDDNHIETSIESIQDEDKRLEMVLKKFSYYSLDNFIYKHSEDDISKNPKFQQLKEVMKTVRRAQKTKDDSKKIELIDSIENENLKVEIIKTINDNEKVVEYIDKIKNENLKLQVIDSIENNEKKLEVLEKLDPVLLKKFRNNSEDINFIKNNIDIFIKNEGFEEKISKEVLDELYEKNNQVVKDIDFRILNQKYIDLLGKDKLNLISCYNDIQKQVLELDDKQCYIFSKCIDDYMKNMETDEWTTLGQCILENMSKGEYSKLIESIENVEELSDKDILTLNQILQNNNWCEIVNINEARDFNEIRKEKCDEVMQNERSTLEQKKEAVIQKVFGHDFQYSKSIIERFGEDIENINDGDQKDYVRALKLLEKIENPKILQEIYDECEFAQTDKALMERALKNEYGRMFNEGLYKPKNENLEEGYSNVYNAGVDFKIIMTSVGAYSGNKELTNYKEDWNRPAISTQHFCTSYIRNDMIGTAPIHDVCYGFSEMKGDSLMLSGNHDIYSNFDSFNSLANRNEKYYTPDSQINNTTKYNEMDFRRIQGGEKKQPDYIIVFRENGTIPNMDKAQIASKQWDNMPIVIVDVDECLKSEQEKIDNMIEKYKENPTSNLEQKIKQKVRNNRVTNRNFCQGIDEKLYSIEHEEELEVTKEEHKVKVSEEELEKNYERVTPNERKSEVSKIRMLYTRMKEISRGEDNEK